MRILPFRTRKILSYPFNFLTMPVSLEAIFLAIFVLMSQNRESKTADLRQEFDVQVNIIAEREITKIIHMLAYIMNHLDMNYEDDEELRQMMRPLPWAWAPPYSGLGQGWLLAQAPAHHVKMGPVVGMPAPDIF